MPIKPLLTASTNMPGWLAESFSFDHQPLEEFKLTDQSLHVPAASVKCELFTLGNVVCIAMLQWHGTKDGTSPDNIQLLWWNGGEKTCDNLQSLP